MFETAELGSTVDKETYNKEAARIRAELLSAQKQLAQANFSVVLIVGGVEGAGKSETVNLLLEWLDARGIQTHAFGEPTDEERERPRYWRYWRLLPAKGHMAIFFGSWYSQPIVDRVFERTTDADLDLSLMTVIAGHLVFTTPFVVLIVAARLQGFDRRLEWAAADLGADGLSTLRHVVLPLISPAIMAGALLSVTLSIDEFGGWKAAQAKFFADGGVFDQIYQPGR